MEWVPSHGRRPEFYHDHHGIITVHEARRLNEVVDQAAAAHLVRYCETLPSAEFVRSARRLQGWADAAPARAADI